MSTFIKLSRYVINTRYITNIEIDNNIYKISMFSNDHSGGLIYGSGYFSTNPSILKVSKEEHEEEHNKISEWLKNDCK